MKQPRLEIIKADIENALVLIKKGRNRLAVQSLEKILEKLEEAGY